MVKKNNLLKKKLNSNNFLPSNIVSFVTGFQLLPEGAQFQILRLTFDLVSLTYFQWAWDWKEGRDAKDKISL